MYPNIITCELTLADRLTLAISLYGVTTEEAADDAANLQLLLKEFEQQIGSSRFRFLAIGKKDDGYDLSGLTTYRQALPLLIETVSDPHSPFANLVTALEAQPLATTLDLVGLMKKQKDLGIPLTPDQAVMLLKNHHQAA